MMGPAVSAVLVFFSWGSIKNLSSTPPDDEAAAAAVGWKNEGHQVKEVLWSCI
jgi:hypothetical protein